MLPTPITLQKIYSARNHIAGIAQRTPLIPSLPLSKLLEAEVFLKLENYQITGSFKVRGAANKIHNLSDHEKQNGVLTVSSGNHGRAVSYVCQKLGHKAVIVLPETVPQHKREAILELGAEVVVHGSTADEAMVFAEHLRCERKLAMVHPFDDPLVIAGQGTIGLEIIEDYPLVDTIIGPLSGGGLMGGIAFTLKAINPQVQTFGVSMEKGAAMVESLKAGKIVDVVEEPTLADALAGGLNRDNCFSFPIVQQNIDSALLVSENEIAEAMTFCLEKHHMVVEGGAAVGVAALFAEKIKPLGKHIVVIISGANANLSTLLRVAQKSYPYQEKSIFFNEEDGR